MLRAAFPHCLFVGTRRLTHLQRLAGRAWPDHMIEERHIFGHLAKRLPQFGHGEAHEAEHAQMHSALHEMESYLRASSKRLSSSKGALPPPLPSEQDRGADAQRSWPKEVWNEVRFAEMVHRLKLVLLPHLEAEETSLKEASILQAGFTEAELREIPL